MSATISLQHTTRAPQRGRTHGGGSSTAPVVERRPARRRVSEATYRRRRAVVGTALAAFVAVGAVTTYDVLAGSGGVPASAAVSQPARSSVVAQPGASLWTIAQEHRGEISLVKYVDKLVALNGGATIHVGQIVVLP
ncbi:MAG: LysM peptidoglycan-binding domain-containing protein [Ilumatobacter fluminis]|uniref:LysM peptidoglycan-binding domain-containing protein n=1 Tax=Ilumatobacter fluminis TaxID=467091 RepID=UPI0032EDABF2